MDMKKYLKSIIILTNAAFSMGQVKDSSDLIFNDNIVNDYRISFYFPNWHDSLVINKSNDETYIPCRFVWYGPKGDSIVLDSVGVRYKGNSSYNVASEKKPFKLFFSKYRKNQRFFSLEKLNFGNGVKDPTMMREKLAYDILRKYIPAPRAAFAILTVGDSIVKSLYTQVEQVDELFLKRHFGTDKYNLYKAGDQGASLAYKTSNQNDYLEDYELKTNEKENDWTRLIYMLERLNNTTDDEFVREVGKILDLDNCIRYLAFNMVNDNFDSYTGSGRNYYLYDDRKSGKFRLIPWDLNLSFAAFPYVWQNNLVGVDAFSQSNIKQRPLIQRIMANDSLKRVYAEYMKKMIAGPLNADSVAAEAYRLKAVIDSFVMADSLKFYSYELFATNIDTELVIKEGIQVSILPGLKSFTKKRNENLRLQIERALWVAELPPPIGNTGRVPIRCYIDPGKLTIIYNISSPPSAVEIKIYDLKGKLSFSRYEGIRGSGTFRITFNTESVASGWYLILLRINENIYSGSTVLIKRN